MKVTIQLCCKVISVVICVLGLLNACLAAPMDAYYSSTDNEITNPQRSQLLKELRDIIDLEDKVKEEDAKNYMVDSEQQGLMRVMPQKRFRPFRTQTRAGGVALCLWKVCPAAPWLVSRRR